MNKDSFHSLLSEKKPEAIKFLLKHYTTSVYNLVIGHVQHQQDAEEITQDVFIAVINSFDSFKGSASFETWLYRIAINKSRDFLKYKYRKKRSAPIVSLFGKKNELVHQPVDFIHPGIQLENKEQNATLMKAIKQLPDKQRTAVILVRLEEMPQKQAATLMDIHLKALESLLSRAKNNLRLNLTELYKELNE